MSLVGTLLTSCNTLTELTIDDLTTYIHPQKYNNIFAQTSIDAQNFWVQIGVDIEARRKLSAKVMPNYIVTGKHASYRDWETTKKRWRKEIQNHGLIPTKKNGKTYWNSPYSPPRDWIDINTLSLIS